VPHVSDDSRVLIYRTSTYGVNYMVDWDDAKRSQRWSCYILDRQTLQKNTDRFDEGYLFDPQLPASAYFSSDPYYGNGSRYEHGHICPSADRLYSAEANKQTFYLTNMQPQFSAFNSGVWLTMENKVRTIATQSDTLFVCKGGTISDGQWGGYNMIYQTLSNGLVVPRYFFVALLRKSSGTYHGIALWFSQVGGNLADTQLASYAISIDELEQRTGIDFFCNLPDEVENQVESTCTPSSWGIR
jgi:endonuclease G